MTDSKNRVLPFSISARNVDAFNNLAKALRNPIHPIALIGAGVSAMSGMPTWNQLLDSFHQRVNQIYSHTPDGAPIFNDGVAAPSAAYLDALSHLDDATWRAQEYRRLLGVDNYGQLLQQAFGNVPAVIHPVLMLLSKLSFRHYLTTNYDDLLESVSPPNTVIVDWSEQVPVQRFLRTLAQPSSDPYLVHLHGRISNLNSLVLTESDYVRRYVLTDETNRRLFALFTTQSLVFIGFSISDPDLKQLLRIANAHLGDGPPQHFAILPLSDISVESLHARTMAGKYGIQAIYYDSSQGHQDLLALLEQLIHAEQTGQMQTFEARESIELLSASGDNTDPNKGRFGEVSQTESCRLSASVTETSYPGWFRFVLQIDNAYPISGEVDFVLHPTFTPSVVTVQLLAGHCYYANFAYGAFTVGVVVRRHGQPEVRLELDLATLDDAPLEFRMK